MIENYNIKKENNLHQMVTEYEAERQKSADIRAKEKQHSRNIMKEFALEESEKIRDKEDYYEELATEMCWDEPWKLHLHYNPNAFMWKYTQHVYDNAWANLVRNYAAVYDAKNLDKYPVSTPLPRMEDLWNPYTPGDFTYKTLKELAAYCSKWRQK